MPLHLEQRQLADALPAVVLVGADVWGEAVLARGGVGLGGGADDGLHLGDVGGDTVTLGGEFLGEVDDGEGPINPILPINPIIDDAEAVDAATMRDDVVLQGGVAAVGLAEGGAGLHLVDVEGAVLALVHHVGQHQHVVVEEAGLE